MNFAAGLQVAQVFTRVHLIASHRLIIARAQTQTK